MLINNIINKYINHHENYGVFFGGFSVFRAHTHFISTSSISFPMFAMFSTLSGVEHRYLGYNYHV